MTMGEKILSMRKARGWSQEEMAEHIGVTRQAVSRWESGAAKLDADKIIAVCDLFGVTTDYLLRDNHSTESVEQRADRETTLENVWNQAKQFSMRPHQWYLLLGLCVSGIFWLAIRFMGILVAERMSFEVFLEREGLEFWYFLAGFAAVLCGLFLFLPPVIRFFYGSLLNDPEE